MTVYDLRPEEFGPWARVILSGRKKILMSYGIPVARTNGKKVTRLWNGYSNITGRHIKAFCGLDKESFLSLPYKAKPDKTALSYMGAMFKAEGRKNG